MKRKLIAATGLAGLGVVLGLKRRSLTAAAFRLRSRLTHTGAPIADDPDFAAARDDDTELRAQTQDQPPAERFVLPREAEPIVRSTELGDFTLLVANGYYTGTALYLRLSDEAREYWQQIASAYAARVKNQFCMELSPGTNSGGYGDE